MIDLKNRKICVTGAAGFVGHHLCDDLARCGADVTGVDRVDPQATKNGNGKVNFIRDDIISPNSSTETLKESEVVVHLAGIANPRVCNSDPQLAFEVNVEGTKRVLEQCISAKRFVFASTIVVYGDQNEVPIKETSPANAKDVYGMIKLMGEQLSKMYHYKYGIPVTILRFANSYGPYQNKDYLIPSLIRQALEEKRIEIWDERPVRDFIYIKDLTAAIVNILRQDVTANETLNVGMGRGYSTQEMAVMISGILNVPYVKLDKKQDVPLKLVCDISKIRSLTGWEPKVGHDQGLRATIDYYLSLINSKEKKG